MTIENGDAPTLAAFDCGVQPTWCPGCGDFGVLRALKLALVQLGIEPHEVLLVTGVGCGSKLPDYVNAYGMLTLHGRPLPFATGAKLANPDLHVIVVDGDGDAYGIGGNHLLHTARRNPDITHIVQNNGVYSLTAGQYSPTSAEGYVSSTSPGGTSEPPVVPTALTFAAGAGFVARGFAGEPKELARIIAAGIEHPGYAHVDVLQPCTTFNAVTTYDWYRERRDYVDVGDASVASRSEAWPRVQEWGPQIPLGVLYQQAPPRRTFEAGLASLRSAGRPVDTTARHDPRDSRHAPRADAYRTLLHERFA